MIKKGRSKNGRKSHKIVPKTTFEGICAIIVCLNYPTRLTRPQDNINLHDYDPHEQFAEFNIGNF